MNKPEFPTKGIIINLIAAIIIGAIIGTGIKIILYIIGIFTGSEYDYKTIIIITSLIIFVISTLVTYSNYNDEIKKYEKENEINLENERRKNHEKLIREEQARNAAIQRKIYLENKIKSIKELTDKLELKFSNSDKKLITINNDFEILLHKNEDKIIKIERLSNKNYVKEFVKLSNYINHQKEEIIFTYNKIINIPIELNTTEGKERHYSDKKSEITELTVTKSIEHFEKLVRLYEQTIFHALNMIVSLLNDKLLIFYQIHEYFDKIGIFETNWQSKMINKLEDINLSLKNVENRLEEGFENLSYSMQESFTELSSTISSDLEKINSNIQFNNLLTAIQTRKLYQIRRDTKYLGK